MPIIEYHKTQFGRVWSVFVFSTILIIIAFMPSLPTYVRVLLVIMGILTIATTYQAFILNVKENKK